MTEQEMELLTIDSFEDFEAGNSDSGFHLDEGSYDGAIVVGYQVVESEFEGKKKTQVKLLWQLTDAEGTVHTLRGSGWTISANEKSKMRIELMKWFDTTEWSKVCDILVKGKILIKHEDGKAHFDMAGFIGKRGKLLIAEKTSKKGSKYPVIMSISKTKNKGEFEFGEVPWFLTEGDDIISVKLADGVKIRAKQEDDEAALAEAITSPVTPKTASTLRVTNPAPAPKSTIPENEKAPDDTSSEELDEDGEPLPF